jgi:ribosomal protein L5
MNILENYYKKVIRYDLINKFFITVLQDITELKKNCFKFWICKSFEIRKFSCFTFFRIDNWSKRGVITTAKRANISYLKFEKGNPVGCKVVLKKNAVCIFFKTFN